MRVELKQGDKNARCRIYSLRVQQIMKTCVCFTLNFVLTGCHTARRERARHPRETKSSKRMGNEIRGAATRAAARRPREARAELARDVRSRRGMRERQEQRRRLLETRGRAKGRLNNGAAVLMREAN